MRSSATRPAPRSIRALKNCAAIRQPVLAAIRPARSSAGPRVALLPRMISVGSPDSKTCAIGSTRPGSGVNGAATRGNPDDSQHRLLSLVRAPAWAFRGPNLRRRAPSRRPDFLAGKSAKPGGMTTPQHPIGYCERKAQGSLPLPSAVVVALLWQNCDLHGQNHTFLEFLPGDSGICSGGGVA